MVPQKKVIEERHYYAQTDNEHKPLSECVPTSVAIASATRYKQAGEEFPENLDDVLIDRYYAEERIWGEWLKEHHRDWWDAGLNPMQTFPFWIEFFKKHRDVFGLSARAAKLSFDDIRAEIDKGQPVVALTAMMVHAGKSAKDAANGHAVCITGYKGDCLQSQDPFGDPLTRYTRRGARGGRDRWISVTDPGWGGKELWCLLIELGAGDLLIGSKGKNSKPAPDPEPEDEDDLEDEEDEDGDEA